MRDEDTRKDLVHLTIGLVCGYSIGFLLVTIGDASLIYYLGGIILLFSMLLTIVLTLGSLAMYWDIKKETGNGIVGSIVQRYVNFVDKIAGVDESYSLEEFEEDIEDYNR